MVQQYCTTPYDLACFVSISQKAKIHISSNFSFNINFSLYFSMPDTQVCRRISLLLSEILLCRPKMNKKVGLH